MELKVNEAEQVIEIKDGLKTQYLVLEILMVLNLVNASMILFGESYNEYGTIEFIWIALGIISLIALFIFLFKKSAAKEIRIDEISELKERSFMGNKRYTIKLKNGRSRDLGDFDNANELAKVKTLLSKINSNG